MKKFIAPFLCALLLAAQGLAAENGEAPPPGDWSGYQGIVIILVGVIFMYFILWRPEQKKRKALEEQRSSLKKGDKVTALGIIGHVDNIKEHTVILKMVDGSKIEVLKAAISDVMNEEEAPQKSDG
jgi:preprotein translocase subunit YajC